MKETFKNSDKKTKILFLLADSCPLRPITGGNLRALEQKVRAMRAAKAAGIHVDELEYVHAVTMRNAELFICHNH